MVHNAYCGSAIQLVVAGMPNSLRTWLTRPSHFEHLPPQHSDGDRAAEHRRQVEDGPVERQPLHPLVQQHGDGQGHDQLQRNADEHVGERHRERLVQPRVAEHPDVVLQPDPLGRLDQAVVGERQVQRGDHRPADDQHQSDQPGQQEQVAGLVVPARLLGPEPLLFRRLGLDAMDRSKAQRWRSWHQTLRFDFSSSTNFCAPSAELVRPKRTSVP